MKSLNPLSLSHQSRADCDPRGKKKNPRPSSSMSSSTRANRAYGNLLFWTVLFFSFLSLLRKRERNSRQSFDNHQQDPCIHICRVADVKQGGGRDGKEEDKKKIYWHLSSCITHINADAIYLPSSAGSRPLSLPPSIYSAVPPLLSSILSLTQQQKDTISYRERWQKNDDDDSRSIASLHAFKILRQQELCFFFKWKKIAVFAH